MIEQSNNAPISLDDAGSAEVESGITRGSAKHAYKQSRFG
jgi:hypothetical protein